MHVERVLVTHMAKNVKQKRSKAPTKAKTGKGKRGKVAVEEVPKRKRGRPSNAELAERARKVNEADAELRRKLIESMAQPKPVTSATTAPVSAAVAQVPKYPVFFRGEHVSMQLYTNRYEGVVVHDPDPINGQMVLVRWDNQSQQWHAKLNLRSMEKALRRKVTCVFKQTRAEAGYKPPVKAQVDNTTDDGDSDDQPKVEEAA